MDLGIKEDLRLALNANIHCLLRQTTQLYVRAITSHYFKIVLRLNVTIARRQFICKHAIRAVLLEHLSLTLLIVYHCSPLWGFSVSFNIGLEVQFPKFPSPCGSELV